MTEERYLDFSQRAELNLFWPPFRQKLNGHIKNQSFKDELKKITNDAFEIDVFGAPTFIVNKKLFWGQDRLEYAIEEFKKN